MSDALSVRANPVLAFRDDASHRTRALLLCACCRGLEQTRTPFDSGTVSALDLPGGALANAVHPLAIGVDQLDFQWHLAHRVSGA